MLQKQKPKGKNNDVETSQLGDLQAPDASKAQEAIAKAREAAKQEAAKQRRIEQNRNYGCCGCCR